MSQTKNNGTQDNDTQNNDAQNDMTSTWVNSVEAADRAEQERLERERKRKLSEVASQDSALFKLLGNSLAPYKKWLGVSMLLMLGTSALNAVPPYLLQQAIDGPIARGEVDALVRITILYGATAVGLFVLTFAFNYFLQQAGQRALADLRTKLFNHILRQDHGFLTGTSTGDLVARLTNDIDQLNAVLSTSIVVVLVEGVTLIVIVVVMFAVNWKLALLSLAVLPIVALTTRYFRSRIRRSSTGERTAQARISAFLNEHLHGMTVVQLFNHENLSENEFEAYNKRYREALVELRWHSAVFLSVQEVLAAIGLGLILYGGGQGVLAGWATLGTLVAFVQYTERAFQPVLRLSQEYNSIQVALGAAERIQGMLVKVPQVVSPPDPLPMGRVLLDGIDIRRFKLEDLRRTVAVVPQDPICLEGTIRHNIALFRDDLTDEEIRRAAEFSNAASFIEELPGQYDFKVLPNGENLSQGQRQLLSLARALALCPDGVLILDEATSSIDTATEALLQEALERVLRTRTSLVIAHRLSTVRNADRIIVMERGRIVEDGNHYTLLEQNGYYARLHRHQLLSEADKEAEAEESATVAAD